MTARRTYGLFFVDDLGALSGDNFDDFLLRGGIVVCFVVEFVADDLRSTFL